MIKRVGGICDTGDCLRDFWIKTVWDGCTAFFLWKVWTEKLYVFPCVILFLCFSVLLILRLPRLGKRELNLVLFVRLFDLCLFGFVSFLFLLGSGKGCSLWLGHSLDFSLTFFIYRLMNCAIKTRIWHFMQTVSNSNSGKNKKSIINLSPSELAQRAIQVKHTDTFCIKK